MTRLGLVQPLKGLHRRTRMQRKRAWFLVRWLRGMTEAEVGEYCRKVREGE